MSEDDLGRKVAWESPVRSQALRSKLTAAVGTHHITAYLPGITAPHVALKLNVTFTAFHIVLYFRSDLVTL